MFGVIGLAIATALAGGFGALQYQQAYVLQEEKSTLQSENNQLSTQLQEINDSYTQLKSEDAIKQSTIQELEAQLGIVKNERDRIESGYSDLQEDYEVIYSESERLSQESTELNQEIQRLLSQFDVQEQQDLLTQLRFNEQTKEVIFYRQMEIYNYKTGDRIPFYWNIPFQYYFWYRSNVDYHNLPYIGLDETVEYYEQALDTWEDLEPLADFIRDYSGSDDELYANMVMQVTHQFYYNITDYTKTPIETFVEGSGDCDTLSVFAAALLEAGGLDSIVLVGYATDSPENDIGVAHAMVGVKLSAQPDDHDRENIWHYDYDDDLYYMGEATWGDVFVDPTDHDFIGSSIGDLPWSEFTIHEVIEA